MAGSFGQQTGWIQLGDLAIAFIFPVRVLKAETSEPKPVAA